MGDFSIISKIHALNKISENLCFSVKTERDLPAIFIRPEDKIVLGPEATEKRLREFALGRSAAYEAMQNVFGENFSIGKGTYGEPIWPEGIIGSITHKNNIAIASVGKRKQSKP